MENFTMCEHGATFWAGGGTCRNCESKERDALRLRLKESSVNEMVKDAHNMAVEKGWWDQARSPLEIHMLIVSEVSEATEAVRNDVEGEKEELADAVIRIMDYFGHMGWDLEKTLREKMSANKSRPYRHGNKLY